MTDTLRLALLQLQGPKDLAAAKHAITTALAQAASEGAQLALLPELHNGPYFCQTQDLDHFSLAEPIPGPSTQYLGALAREFNMVIVGSLFERTQAGVYFNTAVVLETDGTLAGRYRKMHIPQDPGYEEKYYFSAGDLGFKPIDTSLGRLGILVCWDQWFPEAARLLALAGAQCLLIPTAIGWDPRDNQTEKDQQLEAWQTIQRAHAIANGIPLAVCNRVGLEPHPQDLTQGIQFWGHSFIADHQGAYYTQASHEEARVLIHDVNFKAAETFRCQWPFLRDRRVDAYADLMHRIIHD